MTTVHQDEEVSGLRYPLWLIVAAGGLIVALSLGARSTFGLFLEPVAESFNSGLGAVSFAIALQNLIWGFSQPVAGAISDRFGAARVLATGAVLWFGCMWLTSLATGPGMFTLSAGVLAGLAVGAASFSVVLSAVGRMVVPARRSMALGVVSAMGSLGQFVLVPVARWLLDRSTWQTAMVVIGLISLTLVFATPALRGRASDFVGVGVRDDENQAADGLTLREDLRRASRSRAYMLTNAGFFVCGFHVTFIGTHLPSYVSDLGLTAAVGAWALALIGLFNVFGSLAAGALGGRYSKTRLLAGIYGLRAVVIAVYVVVPATSTSTIVFAATIGLLWLATVPLTSGMVTTLFGTANSGALFGIVFLAHQLGSFIGAWMGGVLADRTGSYELMWWIAVALGVAGFLVHWWADERPVPLDPPQTGRRMALAPAAFLLVAGLGAAACLSNAQTAASNEDGPALARWCTLVLEWSDSST